VSGCKKRGQPIVAVPAEGHFEHRPLFRGDRF
jgi:hypothetical protein